MEFDWLDVNFDLKGITPREIEEAFEDPFALRIMPDVEIAGDDARYFCLGKSISDRSILSVFWTNGKNYRVIFARDMTEAENSFYRRKVAELHG